MREQTFTVIINASRHAVWTTLWNDETFRQWAGLIDPNTYMVGELAQGATVQFISADNGYGVTSYVEEYSIDEYVLLRHRADTQDVGERSRPEQWAGGTESYTLDDGVKTTTLTVKVDVPDELIELVAPSYKLAFVKVKELSELHNA